MPVDRSPDPSYAYQYDAMSRPYSMTENGATLATGAQYGSAHEFTQLVYEGWTETRQYNALFQLTRITVPGAVDFEYRYSATQNNGRISQFKDWVAGEEVTYAYDALNRLQSAVTTGPEWGLDFAYDGFGNKTSPTVTKGTGPGLTLGIDQNTNRVIGATYDANGNQYPAGGADYDVFNRLQWHQGEWYGYTADNRRVYKSSTSGSNVDITFWGIDGRRLVTFRAETGGATSSTLYFVEPSRKLYFAGKLIRSGGDSVILDRLGSIRYRKNGSTTERLDYFPYGEEKPGATPQNREKFATYFRDATGLDYADQRYFNSPHDRFLTPDPAGYGLNWYSYTGGDPVNRVDMRGLGAISLNQWDAGSIDSYANIWGDSSFMFSTSDRGGFIQTSDGVGLSDLAPSSFETAWSQDVQVTFLTTWAVNNGATVSQLSSLGQLLDIPVQIVPFYVLIENVTSNLYFNCGPGAVICENAETGERVANPAPMGMPYVSPQLASAVVIGAPAIGAARSAGSLIDDALAPSGTIIYRVSGGQSLPLGRSWTPINPYSVSDYAMAAGLPPQNAQTRLLTGILADESGVIFRGSLKIGANIGGLPEVVVPNPAHQIYVTSWTSYVP